MRAWKPLTRTVAIVLAAALWPAHAAPPHIDLITLGVPDLEAAVSVVEAIGGVRPALGGTHPTRGTHNALLSLGDGIYLEILAAHPAPESTMAPELRVLGRPTLLWWGLRSDDVDATVASLAQRGFATSAPVAGSRTTPEGRSLAWQTFLPEPTSAGGPFFIAWSPDSAHPSSTAPAGCRLESLVVATPDLEALRKLIPETTIRLKLEAAATGRLRLDISCPRGRLSFESA